MIKRALWEMIASLNASWVYGSALLWPGRPAELPLFLSLEKFFERSMPPARRRRAAERLSQDPKWTALYAKYPQGVSAEMLNPQTLLQLPENTLGHQYAKMMIRCGLSADYFEDFAIRDIRDFARQYALRTHDLHHAILGVDTTMFGEMALFSFYVGQNASNRSAVAFVVYNLVRGYFRGGSMDARWMLSQVADGFLAGRDATYFFSVDWVSYLERDIDEVRAELGVKALRNSQQADFDCSQLLARGRKPAAGLVTAGPNAPLQSA